MTLDIPCPACRTVLRLPAFLAGTQVTCASCGAGVQVTTAVSQTDATVATPSRAGPSRAPAPAGPSSDEVDPPAGTPIHAEVVAARADARKRLGRFVLLSELGAGGMGVVHRAWDGRLRRVVALKMLLPGGEMNEDSVKRFFREAEAVARLRHENIVAVFEAGEIEGRPFIAMEFVQGTTLTRSLEKSPRGRLPARAAAELVRDVARALHHAHEQGVIHRDLKPANVMIDLSGKPRVLDFGLARLSGDRTKLTKSGTTLGTPAYMPPEQTGGDEARIDKRSDVYSLGATLYHAVTGRPPFVGSTEYEIVAAVLTKDPPPPSQFEESARGDLETICLRCLEKEPGDRYATAGELARELDRLLDGAEIRAQPVSAASLLARRVQRNRGLSISLVGGLLGVSLVLLLVGKLVNDKRVLEAQLAQKSPEPAASPSASPAGIVLSPPGTPSAAPTLEPVVSASNPPSPSPSLPVSTVPAASPSPEASLPLPLPVPVPGTPSPSPLEPSPGPSAVPVAGPSPAPSPSPPAPARHEPTGPAAKKSTGWVQKLTNDPGRAPYALDCLASDGKVVYGFGGSTKPSNQLWAYDPDRDDGWKVAHKGDDGTAPEPRFSSSLVWTGKHLLLFGGCDGHGKGAKALSDLWAFDPGKKVWKKVTPRGHDAPRARFGHATCWDADRSRLLLLGGATLEGARTQLLSDVWAYSDEKNTWTEEATKESVDRRPPRLRDTAFVWDPAFEEKSPPGRAFAFGGLGLDDKDGEHVFGTIWKLHPKDFTWKERLPSVDVGPSDDSAPAPRTSASAAWDPVGKRMLVFGGLKHDLKTAFGDVWEYDPTSKDGSWSLLETPGEGKPAPRVGRLAWVGTRAILFGGLRVSSTGAQECLNDTWWWKPR